MSYSRKHIPFYLEPWLSNQKCYSYNFFTEKLAKNLINNLLFQTSVSKRKKLIITKRCVGLFILKYILIDFLNLGKKLKFEVVVSCQKLINAHWHLWLIALSINLKKEIYLCKILCVAFSGLSEANCCRCSFSYV